MPDVQSDTATNKSTTSLKVVRPQRGKSKRIYHAPPFMVPNWQFLIDYVPYMASRHYTDLLLNPFTTPTFEKNGDKLGGSPYAFADAKMNHHYTGDEQLSLLQTVKASRALVNKADEYDMGVYFDVALNHVGHKPNVSKGNPVFKKLAEDIEKGIVTFDQVFCRPDEKRSDIAKDWTDVRELRMNTDEEIDNAIKYFAKPYMEYLKLCGAKKVRLDAPHMLPLKFWQKFAPMMVDILTDKDGNPPEILIETIDPLHHYQGIYDSFPEHARPFVHHMNYDSHFRLTDDGARKVHPYHQIYEIETDDRNPFWRGIHDKSLTKVGAALINCTHDATDDNQQTVKTRLDAFNLNKNDFVICRRLYNALMQLSSPEIVRMHTDDGNDFHSQKNLFDAKPIDPKDVATEESYSFSKELNITHKVIHDARDYEWYQAAHVWGQSQCLLHIAREEKGYGGHPTLTFVNASDEIVKLPQDKKLADVLNETYERKCRARLDAAKHNPLGATSPYNSDSTKTCVPQQVNLLGAFDEEQIASIVARYGSAIVNGRKRVQGDHQTEETGMTGTYGWAGGYTGYAAQYSPNPT